MQKSFLLILLFLTCLIRLKAQEKSFADYVQPFIGVLHEGACMPGPALPNASVYPSPNTIICDNGGYAVNEQITGFATCGDVLNPSLIVTEHVVSSAVVFCEAPRFRKRKQAAHLL